MEEEEEGNEEEEEEGEDVSLGEWKAEKRDVEAGRTDAGVEEEEEEEDAEAIVLVNQRRWQCEPGGAGWMIGRDRKKTVQQMIGSGVWR